MKVELDHVVAHPIDRVFAFMANPANRPLWQENTEDVELLSPGEPGLGTRWRETTRGIGRVEAEVVAFEPGALWAEAGTADGGDGRVTVAFSSHGDDATRLDITVELSLRGTRRLLEPALGPMVRSQMPRDLRRLQELLDASAPTPGDDPATTRG